MLLIGLTPAARKPLLHPGRRGGDPHIQKNLAAVTRAEIRIRHLHPGQVGDRRPVRPRRRRGRVQSPPGHGRHFAGHAQHTQAVGAVRRKLEFEDGLFQAQGLGGRSTERPIPVQHQDAVGLFLQTEFGRGAEHPRETIAAELRGLNPLPPGQGCHRPARRGPDRRRSDSWPP